ncbi:hypothetical protein CCP3SC15_1020005 [Gammaproteobacteria bacterium]
MSTENNISKVADIVDGVSIEVTAGALELRLGIVANPTVKLLRIFCAAWVLIIDIVQGSPLKVHLDISADVFNTPRALNPTVNTVFFGTVLFQGCEVMTKVLLDCSKLTFAPQAVDVCICLPSLVDWNLRVHPLDIAVGTHIDSEPV